MRSGKKTDSTVTVASESVVDVPVDIPEESKIEAAVVPKKFDVRPIVERISKTLEESEGKINRSLSKEITKIIPKPWLSKSELDEKNALKSLDQAIEDVIDGLELRIKKEMKYNMRFVTVYESTKERKETFQECLGDLSAYHDALLQADDEAIADLEKDEPILLGLKPTGLEDVIDEDSQDEQTMDIDENRH